MPRSAVVLLIVINVLWAGSSLAAKIALTALPPMTLAFGRFSLAAVLMYLVALSLKVDLRVARRDWAGFWAMGLFGLAVTYLLNYAGIQRTTATNASLLIATEPVFLSLLSWLVWRERMPGAKVGGILAGLAGVVLIVTSGWHAQRLNGLALGDLLIAAGLLFEAGSSIVGKGLVARYPPVSVITYQMTTGAIGLAPFAASELIRSASGGTPIHVTLPSLLALLYLVLPCTVFAYTVWFAVLDKNDAGDMAVFLFIQPVVGALLGVWLLGDVVTGVTIAGASMVLLGIGLINRRPPLPPSA